MYFVAQINQYYYSNIAVEGMKVCDLSYGHLATWLNHFWQLLFLPYNLHFQWGQIFGPHTPHSKEHIYLLSLTSVAFSTVYSTEASNISICSMSLSINLVPWIKLSEMGAAKKLPRMKVGLR